jgi:putative transposase
MATSSEFRSGRHVVFNLHVHLVFLPKYRRGVLTERAFGILRNAWQSVCRDFGCELQEANYEPDHVHLLVAYPPKVALSTLVNSLKGVSARRIRAAKLPEADRKLWGEHFWSPSYCAVSCGGAPLDIVKQYIRAQSHPIASSEGPLLPSVNGGVSAARGQKREHR